MQTVMIFPAAKFVTKTKKASFPPTNNLSFTIKSLQSTRRLLP